MKCVWSVSNVKTIFASDQEDTLELKIGRNRRENREQETDGDFAK